MDNYTIYGALFEAMVRKAILQQYLDAGLCIEEAERFTNKAQLKVVDGVLFETTDTGHIYRYEISTLISLQAIPPSVEIEKHNQVLTDKLYNTDFSKI